MASKVAKLEEAGKLTEDAIIQAVQSGQRGAPTSLFVRGGNSTFNKVLMDGVPANDIGGAVEVADMAMTGVAQAMASIITRPNGSGQSIGNRSAVARRTSFSNVPRW